MKILTFLMSAFLILVSNFTHSVELQGVSDYQRLGKFLYQVSVFSESEESSQWAQPGSPIRLEMKLTADQITKRSFRRIWNEDLSVNVSAEQVVQYRNEISSFSKLVKGKLKLNDLISISNESGKTEVAINGVAQQSHSDPAFANLLVMAWIGPLPFHPQFKRDLINSDPVHKSAYLTTSQNFTQERVQEIKDWKNLSVKKAIATIQAEPPAAGVAPSPATIDKAEQARIDDMIKEEAKRLAKLELERLLAEEKQREQAQQEQLRQQEEQAKQQVVQAEQEDERIAKSLQAQIEYYKYLITKVSSVQRYPSAAAKEDMEGEVLFRVILDREGNLLSTITQTSSGEPILDNAALVAAESGAPYARIPELIAGNEFEFDLLLEFDPKQR